MTEYLLRRLKLDFKFVATPSNFSKIIGEESLDSPERFQIKKRVRTWELGSMLQTFFALKASGKDTCFHQFFSIHFFSTRPESSEDSQTTLEILDLFLK